MKRILSFLFLYFALISAQYRLPCISNLSYEDNNALVTVTLNLTVPGGTNYHYYKRIYIPNIMANVLIS